MLILPSPEILSTSSGVSITLWKTPKAELLNPGDLQSVLRLMEEMKLCVKMCGCAFFW